MPKTIQDFLADATQKASADLTTAFLWNMTYHEGQINYIAPILGCLE